jgi:arsenite methyltransferase
VPTLVAGVDMTDGQLEVARKYSDEFCTSTLGYPAPNMRFVKVRPPILEPYCSYMKVKSRFQCSYFLDLTSTYSRCAGSYVEGTIEDLKAADVADASMDLIISNCVVNLSPDKPAVLSEAHRALADGGEFYFSDVYCDRRLPEDLRSHEILLGECLGGAMYIEDFKRLCAATGFTDPRVLEGHEIEVRDEALAELLGEAKFYSLTYRLFKLPVGVGAFHVILQSKHQLMTATTDDSNN